MERFEELLELKTGIEPKLSSFNYKIFKGVLRDQPLNKTTIYDMKEDLLDGKVIFMSSTLDTHYSIIIKETTEYKYLPEFIVENIKIPDYDEVVDGKSVTIILYVKDMSMVREIFGMDFNLFYKYLEKRIYLKSDPMFFELRSDGIEVQALVDEIDGDIPSSYRGFSKLRELSEEECKPFSHNWKIYLNYELSKPEVLYPMLLADHYQMSKYVLFRNKFDNSVKSPYAEFKGFEISYKIGSFDDRARIIIIDHYMSEDSLNYYIKNPQKFKERILNIF